METISMLKQASRELAVYPVRQFEIWDGNGGDGEEHEIAGCCKCPG